MRDFKEIYTLPLKNTWGKVFTKDDNLAFDFPMRFIFPDCIKLSEESQDELVAIINGEKPNTKKHNFTYDDGNILLDDKLFIIIRGWGHLTGIGGLNLSSEEAVVIQDNFAKYIIGKLN